MKNTKYSTNQITKYFLTQKLLAFSEILILTLVSYSCTYYTKQELDAAETRTNEERIKFSSQKLNDNASKFRKNYFAEKKLDSAAAHEDSIYSRSKIESAKAAKTLHDTKEDEDDIRDHCCKR